MSHFVELTMPIGYQGTRGNRRSNSASVLRATEIYERRGSSEPPTRPRFTEDNEDETVGVLTRRDMTGSGIGSHEMKIAAPDQLESLEEALDILESSECLTSSRSNSDPSILPLSDEDPAPGTPASSLTNSPKLSPETRHVSLPDIDFTNPFEGSPANNSTITSKVPLEDGSSSPRDSRRASHAFGEFRRKSFASVANIFKSSNEGNTATDIAEAGRSSSSSQSSTRRRRSSIRKKHIGKPRFEGCGAFGQSPLQNEIFEEPLDAGNLLREITIETFWQRHLQEFRRKISIIKPFRILKGDPPPPRQRTTSLSEPRIMSHPDAWKLWNVDASHALDPSRGIVSRPPDMCQDKSEIDMLHRTSIQAIELDMILGGVDRRIEANQRCIERLHVALSEKGLERGRVR